MDIVGDSSKRAEGSVAKKEFLFSLNSYVVSKLGCEDLRTSKVGGGPFTQEPSDIALTKWQYQGFSNIRGGYDANKRKLTPFRFFDLEVMQANLVPVAGALKVPTAFGGGTEELLKGTLILRFSLKVEGRSYKNLINLPVLVTSDGTLRFCGDERNIAESCAAMKGVYDPIAQKCNLKEGCMLKGTYVILKCDSPPCNTSLGSNLPNKYTGGYSCPQGSQAINTQASNWTSLRENGKKSTEKVGNSMEWYTCIACPEK